MYLTKVLGRYLNGEKGRKREGEREKKGKMEGEREKKGGIETEKTCPRYKLEDGN